MNYEKEKQYHISFCGSYCHICDWHTGRIRKTFQSAADALKLFGFRRLLEGKVAARNLRRGLDILTKSSICPGCKAEAGQPPGKDRCRIRPCAHAKGFDLCSECPDFPCRLLKTDPGVVKFGCIENLRQIKSQGLKRWVDGQWKEYVRSSG